MLYVVLWIFCFLLQISRTTCSDNNSNIIGNGQILFDLIGNQINQTYTLLYRATIDGFEASSFHTKCDGKEQTLTLIKTTNGYVFGGYANIAWQSSPSDSYGNDPDAFLFSLINPSNKPTVIKVSGTYAINSLRFYSSYGPSFGANDLIITDCSNTGFASLSDLGISYLTTEARTFFTGAINFKTTEIEVYQSNQFINATTSNVNSVTSATMLTTVNLGKIKN